MKNLNFGLSIMSSVICISCSTERTITSVSINDKAKRIQILSKEVKLFSKINNAEYHLYNVNGFTDSSVFLPGSSSLKYLFVVKVDPHDVDNWKENLVEKMGETVVPEWTYDLTGQRKAEWNINSKPKFYSRNDESDNEIIIFEKEGIIFKRVVQD